MNTSIGLQSANNVNRFQYKTPNLSDRLKSEQLHEEMVKVRKHFTLKLKKITKQKEWVTLKMCLELPITR